MSACDAPLCRLCGKAHWQREGCDFGKNTQREGRDVVKPKGTSTEGEHPKARPATRPRKPGGDGTAAKPKTAPKKKRKKARKAK